MKKRKHYDSELSGYSYDLNLVGLDTFKKKLEKHFFAIVDIRKLMNDGKHVELVVEVDCTINFALAIQHFRVDVLSNVGVNSNFLMNCLTELQHKNTETIDIKELSFLMSDTSIFIQQVCEYGVVQQLDNVMRILMNDYHSIISRFREIPREVHIPVLEDTNNVDDDSLLLAEFGKRTTEKDYFTFWGLYFDSREDTVIYDVEKSDFIFEELCYVYD